MRKEVLRLAIVSRGSLESAKNGDVMCTVRARSQGSTVATSIKWLVDAGTFVSKDEKIMELDSSGLVEQLKSQNITVEQAKANMNKAEEDYRIQEIDNENDILQNENKLELAKIDLEKYIEGDFEQALRDVEGRITIGESDVADWLERSQWSKRMVRKGLMSKVAADCGREQTAGSQHCPAQDGGGETRPDEIHQAAARSRTWGPS